MAQPFRVTDIGQVIDDIVVIDDLSVVRQAGGSNFELHVPSLSIPRGSFVSLVGDSGCGKSTLLDIFALVSSSSHCQKMNYMFKSYRQGYDVLKLWETNNESILSTLRAKNLGYVLQTGGLLSFLTVKENILLPVHVNGNQITNTTLEKLATRLGIQDLLSKKPHQLSGGQRQRVAILRALIHQPEVILADEPTASVDKPRAREIVTDFRQMVNEQDVTVFMATHDKELAMQFATHLIQFQLTKHSKNHVKSIAAIMPLR